MIHYSVVAMPEECYEQVNNIDNEEFHSDFNVRFAYEHKGVSYYHIDDYDEMLTTLSEYLNDAGIPHNAYPIRLDGLVCVTRYEPDGTLIESWASFDDYILTRFNALPEGSFVSDKVLATVEWEDKWENQLHYGRIHALKRQLEGK